MTIADMVIFIAALIPYAMVAYAKIISRRTFDNARPRAEGGYEGAALRAYHAHLNSFESFPFFAAAVIIAQLHAGASIVIDVLAILFVVARIAHAVFYINDRPTQRSVSFTIGLLLTILIFLSPLVLK